MSIKDLIWVRVAQSIRAEEKSEFEIQKVKAEFEASEQIFMAIIDLQEICIDIDWYAKVAALKESPKEMRKVSQIKRDQLPSAIMRKQREEAARRAKMTPEERQAEDIKKFIAGEKYTPE
jgi:hypothetical protein